MATFNKLQDYVEQLNKAVHNWSAHTFKAAFSNTAPSATNAVLAVLSPKVLLAGTGTYSLAGQDAGLTYSGGAPSSSGGGDLVRYRRIMAR